MEQWSRQIRACCAEFDLWEANSQASALTAHPCTKSGLTKCSGVQCGDGADRVNGLCDKDGCDFNTYRLGAKNFFGAGSKFKVDTTKPFTLVTQFITTDGTDTGDLKEVKRFYVQNGVSISNPAVNITGLPTYNSLTDATCKAQKTLFGETNTFASKGGMKAMGQALDRGMVLVLSLWDDNSANMLWLDSDFPLSANRNSAGV